MKVKSKFQEKIEGIIAAYKANHEQSVTKIKKVIDEWKDQVNIYTAEYLNQSISEGIKAITSGEGGYEEENKVYNQKMKLAITDEKERIIPMLPMVVKPVTKPADYATKVGNALKYLELEGAEITDEAAYDYLKEFMDDYDQMKIFKRVIGKQVEVEDANGKATFKRTFGKLNDIELILNTFNEMESVANRLFLYEKDKGQTYIVNGVSYSLPRDFYEQEEDEGTILKQLADIEEQVNKIPGVENISDATEHETIEN